MTIRNQDDVRALDEKIQRELGIDVGKYRDEDTIATLSELLVFPLYALSWTIRPVLLAFVLYLAGFFVLELVHVQYLVYGILGLVLFLFTGLFAGLLYLTIRFGADIRAMMDYSLGVLRGIVEDLDRLNRDTDATNRAEVLKLLFLGVTHLITIPAVGTVVGNRVPLIGGWVAGIVRRVLTRLSNLFRFDRIELERARVATGDEGKILPLYVASVTGVHRFTERTLSVALRVVRFPLGLGFAFFAGLTLLFIWLIH